VTNKGRQPASNLRADFLVRGERRDTQVIDNLAPGEARDIVFTEVFPTSGANAVTVALDGDRQLAIDDRRHLALSVVDRIRVLLVDGDPRGWSEQAETHYLAHALAPEVDGNRLRHLFQRRVVDRREFQREQLLAAGIDLVVLCNVSYLSEEKEVELEKFVRQGGGLLIFLGDQVRSDVYNERLLTRGLLPGKLAAAPVGDVGYDAKVIHTFDPDYDHSLFTFFRDHKQLFVHRMIGRYVPVEPSADSAVRVAARFGTGPTAAPAIIERRLDKGRVMLVTTTADDGWHFMTQYDVLLLPLVHEIVYFMVARLAGDRNVLVNTPLELPLREVAREIRLASPDARGMPSTNLEKLRPSAEIFTYSKTEQPGIYRIELDRVDARGEGRGRVEDIYFAANVNPEEGELRHLGEEQLARTYPLLKERPFSFGASAKILADSGGRDQQGQIWQALVLLALLLMLGESALSARTSR
jgi:hypothetical protein